MKVFVSSSCYGSEERRSRIRQTIQRAGCHPIMSEQPDFPVWSHLHSHDACVDAVALADVVVLLIQPRYGQGYRGVKPAYHGISVTHAEYREARRLGKQMIVLADSRISDERHARLHTGAVHDSEITNDVIVFFDEVHHSSTGNWIHMFSSTDDCVSHLKRCLVFLWNESLSSSGQLSSTEHFAVPRTLVEPGVSVASHWECTSESWDWVIKRWTVSLKNATGATIEIEQSSPLVYPMYYPGCDVRTASAQLGNPTGANDVPVNARMEDIGHPVNGTALVISSDTLSVPSGCEVTFSVALRHAGYFRRIGDHMVHQGKLVYLEYPPFSMHRVVQRISTEVRISRELVERPGHEMRILSSPEADWCYVDSTYIACGFGREMRQAGFVPIALLAVEA